jgi:hypothetical protein
MSVVVTRPLSRRIVVAGGLAAPFAAIFPEALAQGDFADLAALKPGQFAWHPERSPAGPVVILVSLPEQRVVVYRNGIRIAGSTCSTGKPGHTTPAGVFLILQKDKTHHSSTYNNAPMPFMERVTWQGVALHAGNLPGYPASHGCVRLPLEFAKLLFGVTHVGTPVIIADVKTSPADVLHPGILIPAHGEEEARAAVAQAAAKSHPAPDANSGGDAVSILISTADRTLIAFVDGEEKWRSPIKVIEPDKPFGTHAFTLIGPSADPNHLKWFAIGLDAGATQGFASQLLVDATIRRIDMPPDAARTLSGLLHPGATLVLTDRPASDDTRTAKGYTIVTHDET